MNTVPLISIKKGILFDGKDGTQISIDNVFKQIEKDTMLYILDFDGIARNNPSLDLCQELTEHCTLWIDSGPRRIDDIMDMVMAGATNITLREELWPEMELHDILELTDDEVYLCINLAHRQQSQIARFTQRNIGIVIFNLESQTNNTFTSINFFKNQTIQHKIYLYIVALNTISQWREQGITGILIDLNKL